jgi:hypothetical protein
MQVTNLTGKDTHRMKGYSKSMESKSKQWLLYSDKAEFKPLLIRGDKEDHYVNKGNNLSRRYNKLGCGASGRAPT